MNRRTKMLAIAVGILGSVFVLDELVVGPGFRKWDALAVEIQTVDQKLGDARSTVAREPAVREGWNKVTSLLAKSRTPDVPTHFVSHLGAMCDTVGVNFDVQGSRNQTQGDFKEYVYETKFRLTWEQLVVLLVELQNSKEFLKPLRLSITSHYDREDRLDLSLRVSTIEHAPAARGGSKP